MKYLMLPLTILLLASCQNENSSDGLAIIEGRANPDFANKELYLQYIHNDSLVIQALKVDSEGNFQLQLDSITSPTEAILLSDTTNYLPKVNIRSQFSNKFTFQFGSGSVPVQFGKKIDFQTFLIDEGTISFDISDSLYNSQIGNSSLNAELEEFRRSLQPVMREYTEFQNKWNDFTTIEDMKLLDSLNNAYFNIWRDRHVMYTEYILNNPESPISLFALRYRDGGINTDVLRLYETLSDTVKESEYGNFMAMQVASFAERMNKQLAHNDVVPNFKLKNKNGKEINLYDVKAKYILLDFWASWCGPCRSDNKVMSGYYDAFDRSDFQIVAVSVDDSEKKWQNALIEDNATWVSLWDEDKKINDQFGIIAYPTSFLLNDKFQIIDSELGAERLKERLTELLESEAGL